MAETAVRVCRAVKNSTSFYFIFGVEIKYTRLLALARMDNICTKMQKINPKAIILNYADMSLKM